MSYEQLKECDLMVISMGRCPDCDHRGFVLGPRGGSAINVECGNLECRARFNIATAPFSHRVVVGQRIPKASEGGSDWDHWAKDDGPNYEKDEGEAS